MGGRLDRRSYRSIEDLGPERCNPDWFAVRLQKLCSRAPVTGEVGDKRLADGIRDRSRCLKVHDIEEVARVLSVQRRTQLAGIEIR